MKTIQTPNLTWLTRTLATGGSLSYDLKERELQAEYIVGSGVTHIIDLRAEDHDTEFWMRWNVHYTNLATFDAHGHHISAELFDAAVDFARQADKAGGKVLAHCHMGVNRGPSVAAAILMDRGMSAIEAFDLIREKRPQAAVYYLMDAYRAHTKRILRDPSTPVEERNALVASMLRESKVVKRHWEKVVDDPDTIAHVNGYIRDLRKKDDEFFRNQR